MRDFYRALVDILDAGTPAATATIVKVTGSTPRTVGARMIVRREGLPLFTLGGGAFEAGVIEAALEAIAGGTAVLKEFSLATKGPAGDGQECGGTATVFIDPATAPEKLWIFGGGHVGRALAAASQGLGMDVTVFDDRADYATLEHLPGAQRAVKTDEEYRDVPAPDGRTYCVVATRAHKTDRAALRSALRGNPSWVGMIGSARKRLAVHKELLEEDGVPAGRLETVETPVGLSIGAETPEEIAIAILARLIQVRRQPA